MFQPNLLEIYALFIIIYDPVANFETHPLSTCFIIANDDVALKAKNDVIVVHTVRAPL